MKRKKRATAGEGSTRRSRPSLEETTRSLLAQSYPNACDEQLDAAAELLAHDLTSDEPEPDDDELTDAEGATMHRVREILGVEAAPAE